MISQALASHDLVEFTLISLGGGYEQVVPLILLRIALSEDPDRLNLLISFGECLKAIKGYYLRWHSSHSFDKTSFFVLFLRLLPSLLEYPTASLLLRVSGLRPTAWQVPGQGQQCPPPTCRRAGRAQAASIRTTTQLLRYRVGHGRK